MNYRKMYHLVKDLWLAVLLIAGASAVLLFSDLDQRNRKQRQNNKAFPSVAIMQITSTTLLDEHVAGVMDRLQSSGYVAPDAANVRIFNAQGDYAMANTIAREIVNGPYELVITSSTLALQVFSKTNVSVQKYHVFGAVTDPYGAGVGINGPEPNQHPPYMTGIGTFQPVKNAFRLAREMNPQLKRVGVVWNPGEQCSEACMFEARAICRELGIELVPAIATTTSEVSEAVRSLVSKQVDAIWIGGDTVANSSISMIIGIARQAGIPVFTNDHADARKGALFGLGANYFTVGQYTANMAVDILEGTDPANFRIENVVPELFRLNQEVLVALHGSWAVNDVIQSLLDQDDPAGVPPAQLPIEETKVQKRIDPGMHASNQAITSPFKLRIVHYSDTEFAERCHEGLVDGIQQAGFSEGRDYQLRTYNAQGDMSTLSSIMNTIKADRVDLLMVISTPTLQAALRQAGQETKIVFTGVGDAVKAGAGNSETDHLPNVTGITTRSPFTGMAKIIKETMPGARRVGTLFTPAEINSVLYKDWFKEALEKEGLELLAIPVTSSADVSQAAADLCGRDIHVLCQIVDNMTRPGFALIARKAAEKDVPVFVFDSDQMKDGGAICLSRDYYDAGLEAAEKAVRVLRGQNPAFIPFSNTQSETLLVNKELVKRYGLKLSDELTNKATLYIP